MLRILIPRTGGTDRPHSDIHHAQCPQSTSEDVQKQSRPFSIGSATVHAWMSMDLRPSSALKSASEVQYSTRTKQNTTDASTFHVPTRSLSVSETTPKRAALIATTKAVTPTQNADSVRQDHAIPHLTKTPWEVERYKRNSTWKRSSLLEFPARIFMELPREIYDCIVSQLEHIHLQQDQGCPTCYLHDLYSLSLASRAWDKAATLQMYRRAYVVGRDDHSQRPKAKLKGPSRLKLLRRTLRDRPALARLVRELHLADFQTQYQQASIEREDIVNLVASLVMACPSLERLVGFHIPFSQSFDRLSYALATRPKLRERVWLLSEPEDNYSYEEDDDEASGYYLAACDSTERFLDLNSGYPLLTSLVLHRTSDEFAPTLNFRAIFGTFRQLPMLQHLSISGLSALSFTNLALNALPPRLQSLRLENLPGINDKGLQRFATSHLSTSIEKLTLINLEISNLITITNILSEHLSKLKHFAIVQYRTPDLSARMSAPSFCCPSLQFIHFEFRSQSGPAIDPFSSPNIRQSMDFPFVNSEPISCLAISLLATNIKEGAFPSLRRVRIPHDPQGIAQALCQPLATALLPTDTSLHSRPVQKTGLPGFTNMIDAHTSQLQSPGNRDSSNISFRADSAIESPIFDSSPSPSTLSPANSRLAAQARLLAARKAPFMNVRVYDPEGEIRIDTDIGGFLGDINSSILYSLTPDKGRWPGNRDQSGPPQPEWITGIEDLVDERTPSGDRSCERFWGNCGHLVGGRLGCNTVRVDELF